MGKNRQNITKTDKVNMYRDLQIDTCIYMGNAMGIPYKYDDWAKELLISNDYEEIRKSVLKKFKITSFDYDENGYDDDLIPVILEKVAATMKVKVSDYEDIAVRIRHHIDYIFDDSIVDVYKEQFDLARDILEIARRRGIHNSKELGELMNADIYEFVGKFMFTAYEVLPKQSFNDVKQYRDTIFDVLSQLKDLHTSYGSYAMMDVADLHIWHGNDNDGDKIYLYLLRETVIKDYIYYRYAFAYSDYDPEKARTIAKEAMQHIDDKFFFYDAIVNILEN